MIRFTPMEVKLNIRTDRENTFSARFAGLFATAAFLLAGVSCVSQPQTPAGPAAANQPIRVGLFLDEGCQGNGVLRWAQLIEYSPELELVPLTGKDIREGRLQGLRLLVCPGGGSARQLKAMQPRGAALVKQFIADGGSYVGACAGCYNVLNRQGRMGLLPYDYIKNASGKYAALTVDFSEAGAKRLGIKTGRCQVRYHGGPVLRPTAPTGRGSGETVAVYKSSSGRPDRAPYNFLDTPSAIYGTYGKGKVIATSFHPESWDGTHDIALGCIYAVTGVKPRPVYPEKSWRRIRVGFCICGPVSPRTVHKMLMADRHPELDVQLISSQEILEGLLNHLDIIFVPEGKRESYQAVMKNPIWKNGVQTFMDRGGLVLAEGNGVGFVPAHANLKVLQPGDDLTARLRKP